VFFTEDIAHATFISQFYVLYFDVIFLLNNLNNAQKIYSHTFSHLK